MSALLQEDEEKKSSVSEVTQLIIGHELYEPLDKTEDFGKRQEIQKKLKEKIDQASDIFTDKPNIGETLRERVLKRGQAGRWLTFGAVVTSVEHVTQAGGKDDYCLLYYDAQRNTLFIAKEIFFELDVDLIAEFLFLELSDGTLTKP